MERVLSDIVPDMIIHLGDCEDDTRDVSYMYHDIPLHSVYGNCDSHRTSPREKVVSAGDMHIYCTHGHQFNVKHDILKYAPDSDIVTVAKEMGAEIALFGHTHIPHLSFERGVHVLNPGSASTDKKQTNNRAPTFALIDIQKPNIICKILAINFNF